MYPIPGVEFKAPILAALEKIDWDKLSNSRRCDLLRVYTIVFTRLGSPDRVARDAPDRRFDGVFPAKNYEVNADLSVAGVPRVPRRRGQGAQAHSRAPSQEEQIDYAKSLARLETGWNFRTAERIPGVVRQSRRVQGRPDPAARHCQHPNSRRDAIDWQGKGAVRCVVEGQGRGSRLPLPSRGRWSNNGRLPS